MPGVNADIVEPEEGVALTGRGNQTLEHEMPGDPVFPAYDARQVLSQLFGAKINWSCSFSLAKVSSRVGP